MMMRNLWVVAVLANAVVAMAQQPPDPNYVRQPIFDSYADFRAELDRVANIQDAAQRNQEVGAFWAQLRDAGQVPYAQGNQVAFLYRGNGNVSWPGDTNRWNPNADGWNGTTVGLSNIKILERQLPSDARIDYKLFVNGNWLLDPANPLQMWSGFGPNSELRMPDYEYPHSTIHRDDVDHGQLSGNVRVASNHLGQDVNVKIYTPAGYDPTQSDLELPAVYFTDGHEYSAEHMGSAVQVIDNLIADGRVRPLVAVFIDPRHPNTGANQRADHYISNRDFARFVANELVDHVDSEYTTSTKAADRTIVGTSLGGLNSAYFGQVENDTFQNLGIQSPALSFSPAVAAAYANGALADDVKIFMTNGTINDDGGGFAFANILRDGGYDYSFATANEGHSWGNWRTQLDEMLVSLVGPPVPEPATSWITVPVLFWASRFRSKVRARDLATLK